MQIILLKSADRVLATMLVNPMRIFASDNACYQATGLIPSFISSDTVPMKKQLDEAYGFGVGWQDCTKDENFTTDRDAFAELPVFAYGEKDKPLAPIAVIANEQQEQLYIYPNALVVLLTPDEFLWGRMD